MTNQRKSLLGPICTFICERLFTIERTIQLQTSKLHQASIVCELMTTSITIKSVRPTLYQVSLLINVIQEIEGKYAIFIMTGKILQKTHQSPNLNQSKPSCQTSVDRRQAQRESNWTKQRRLRLRVKIAAAPQQKRFRHQRQRVKSRNQQQPDITGGWNVIDKYDSIPSNEL